MFTLCGRTNGFFTQPDSNYDSYSEKDTIDGNEIWYKVRSTVSMTSDSESDAAKKALGSVYTEHQHQGCDNSWMTLAILFSLKTMESLENGLQPHSGATLLFEMGTVSLV